MKTAHNMQEYLSRAHAETQWLFIANKQKAKIIPQTTILLSYVIQKLY